MSDRKPEPVSAEANAVASEAALGSVAAAPAVESPGIAPNQEETAPKEDVKQDLKADAKVEPKFEAPKVEAKAEAPKAEPKKAEPRVAGNVMIMSPGDRMNAGAKSDAGQSSKRRFAAMAAVATIALIAGAVGGALATAMMGHSSAHDVASVRSFSLETSVARLDADILALKAGAEQNAKQATGQFNKTSDRLDKIEKAQSDPSARIAKLSETVEKLRKEHAAQAAAAPAAAAPVATPVAAAVPAAAKDVTGSIAPPATAAAAPSPAASAKVEVGRLPTVEGWVLRDVGRGVALIEGRRGMYEVYAGDPIPGLGRVDAIRKQDGRWVVVTSKGLIVSR